MRSFIGEFVLFVSVLVLVLSLFQVSFILVYRSVRVWVDVGLNGLAAYTPDVVERCAW